MVQLKIGDKVKGFKFNNYNYIEHGFYLKYTKGQDAFIGKRGVIIRICDRNLKMLVEFSNDLFWYPVYLIKNTSKIQSKLR